MSRPSWRGSGRCSRSFAGGQVRPRRGCGSPASPWGRPPPSISRPPTARSGRRSWWPSKAGGSGAGALRRAAGDLAASLAGAAILPAAVVTTLSGPGRMAGSRRARDRGGPGNLGFVDFRKELPLSGASLGLSRSRWQGSSSRSEARGRLRAARSTSHSSPHGDDQPLPRCCPRRRASACTPGSPCWRRPRCTRVSRSSRSSLGAASGASEAPRGRRGGHVAGLVGPAAYSARLALAGERGSARGPCARCSATPARGGGPGRDGPLCLPASRVPPPRLHPRDPGVGRDRRRRRRPAGGEIRRARPRVAYPTAAPRDPQGGGVVERHYVRHPDGIMVPGAMIRSPANPQGAG